MSGLQTYCEHTSLHGWYYIAKDKKYWKIVWGIIVVASIIVASIFIYKAAEDFTKSTVVTTIQSTTVPLSEVYFPAVTVCNINQVLFSVMGKSITQGIKITLFSQVRKSFFNDLNINNNVSIVDLLYEQFYTGSIKEPTEEEQEFMRTLFTSETYVKSELKYVRTTQRGSVEDGQLSNWTAYLDRYREYIEKGFQFTRLAVQEPYGKLLAFSKFVLVSFPKETFFYSFCQKVNFYVSIGEL